MIHHDTVCGSIIIDEPVILDLIQSPALDRLRGIDQSGYPGPFFPLLKINRHTRFDHSIGVYGLLKRYHAPLEEQVAGLIHDVSHSAFSHCADYISGDQEEQKSQSHQDSIFSNFVRGTEIPAILDRHGLDIEYILNDDHFPLKETVLPDLCADRIEYSLRSALALSILSEHECAKILNSLTVWNSKWVFQDHASAKSFAEMFDLLNTRCYSHFLSAAMMHCTGHCLQHALQRGYLTREDLYTNDATVLDKITIHLDSDPELRRRFARMNNAVPMSEDPHREHVKVFCKSRIVDPLCRHAGSIQRLSSTDSVWAQRIHDESAPKMYCISFHE